MKRNIAVILFLISMIVVISHDLIPHQHVDPDESEMVTGRLNDSHEQSKSKNNNNQKNHFPLHQHLFSDCDIITGQNNISINKVIKDPHQDLGCLSFLLSDPNDNTYFTGFVRVIKNPLTSYPYIIPFNSTRGSPFLS